VRVHAFVWVGGCTKRDTRCKLTFWEDSPLLSIRVSEVFKNGQLVGQGLTIVMVVYQVNDLASLWAHRPSASIGPQPDDHNGPVQRPGRPASKFSCHHVCLMLGFPWVIPATMGCQSRCLRWRSVSRHSVLFPVFLQASDTIVKVECCCLPACLQAK
jgi:hypothetical protein